MSTYAVRFGGSYSSSDELEQLQAAHTDMVKGLAEAIEPNAQGSFGVDELEHVYSTVVTGVSAGDHLESATSVFEVAGSALSLIDPSTTGSLTYVDDDGLQTIVEFPSPAV